MILTKLFVKTFIKSCWGVLLICALLTRLIPQLNSIGRHGKCQSQSPSQFSMIEKFHEICQVPKSLFKVLYFLGFWISVITFFFSVIHSSSCRIQGCILLWMIHNFRRLCECCFITIYGSSSMHVGGFLAGFLHYTLVPLTLLSVQPRIPANRVLDLIGFSGFWLANLAQYHSHYILFSMKSHNAKSNVRYQLPTQSFFRFVSCPHYTAEIVIYFSFLLLVQFDDSAIVMFFWVVTNLAVVAHTQFEWYQERYPSRIPLDWKRLIPGVW